MSQLIGCFLIQAISKYFLTVCTEHPVGCILSGVISSKQDLGEMSQKIGKNFGRIPNPSHPLWEFYPSFCIFKVMPQLCCFRLKTIYFILSNKNARRPKEAHIAQNLKEIDILIRAWEDLKELDQHLRIWDELKEMLHSCSTNYFSQWYWVLVLHYLEVMLH